MMKKLIIGLFVLLLLLIMVVGFLVFLMDVNIDFKDNVFL